MAHKLHEMLEKIEECLYEQLNKGIQTVDTEEYGKVADIYKDLMCAKKDYFEGHYYKTLVEAMNESDSEEILEMFDNYNDDRRFYDNYRYKRSGRFAPKGRGSHSPRRGYDEPNYKMTPEMYKHMDWDEVYNYGRDMDRMNYGRMYYTENGNGNSSSNNSPNNNSRDSREGRSGQNRVRYYETKMHHTGNTTEDKQIKMKSLEEYMHGLSDDITEMISDASQEEKNLLKQKLQVLTQKI